MAPSYSCYWNSKCWHGTCVSPFKCYLCFLHVSIVVHNIFHFDYMPICYILNVARVVAPILLGDSQFVNIENMSHGQSSTKVTPLEHATPTTLRPKVTAKPRYSFMKKKLWTLAQMICHLQRKVLYLAYQLCHHQMKVIFFEIWSILLSCFSILLDGCCLHIWIACFVDLLGEYETTLQPTVGPSKSNGIALKVAKSKHPKKGQQTIVLPIMHTWSQIEKEKNDNIANTILSKHKL